MYYGSGTVAHTASQWRHALGWLAGSGRMLLHLQQRAADGRPSRHLRWQHIRDPTPSVGANFLLLPNFIPIWFETTEPWAFFEQCRPNNNKKKNKKKSEWLATWNQFLIQKLEIYLYKRTWCTIPAKAEVILSTSRSSSVMSLCAHRWKGI